MFLGVLSLFEKIHFDKDKPENFNLYLTNMRSEFVVGAPNQFYFGIMKGKTALDKFKTKYSLNE